MGTNLVPYIHPAWVQTWFPIYTLHGYKPGSLYTPCMGTNLVPYIHPAWVQTWFPIYTLHGYKPGSLYTPCMGTNLVPYIHPAWVPHIPGSLVPVPHTLATVLSDSFNAGTICPVYRTSLVHPTPVLVPIGTDPSYVIPHVQIYNINISNKSTESVPDFSTINLNLFCVISNLTFVCYKHIVIKTNIKILTCMCTSIGH